MPIRMSSNMISYNYKTGLNNALYKLNKMQEQIYNQTMLSRPSDNPVNTVLSMRYKINLTTNEQYTANTNMAISWMDSTHDSMSDITEILHRVRELVVDMADPEPKLAYEAAAEEINGLINRAIQVGNTTLGDRYIFAGQNDRGQAPYYLEKGDPSIPTPDRVIYTGDDYKVSMVINPGSTTPSQDSVNLTGNEVFNNGKLFEDLIAIRDALQDNTMSQNDLIDFLSNDAIKMVDENMDALLSSQSRVSARVSMYKLGQNILKSDNVRINENISQVEDVNLGSAALNFTIAQNAYNAALSMGAKLLPMSLADFLR